LGYVNFLCGQFPHFTWKLPTQKTTKRQAIGVRKHGKLVVARVGITQGYDFHEAQGLVENPPRGSGFSADKEER
jgi:hypothetical protein